MKMLKIPPTAPPKWAKFEIEVGNLKIREKIQEKMKKKIAKPTGIEFGIIRFKSKITQTIKRKIALKVATSWTIKKGKISSMNGNKESKTSKVGIFCVGCVKAATVIKPKIEPEEPIKGKLIGNLSKILFMMSKIAAKQPEEM